MERKDPIVKEYLRKMPSTGYDKLIYNITNTPKFFEMVNNDFNHFNEITSNRRCELDRISKNISAHMDFSKDNNIEKKELIDINVTTQNIEKLTSKLITTPDLVDEFNKPYFQKSTHKLQKKAEKYQNQINEILHNANYSEIPWINYGIKTNDETDNSNILRNIDEKLYVLLNVIDPNFSLLRYDNKRKMGKINPNDVINFRIDNNTKNILIKYEKECLNLYTRLENEELERDAENNRSR